LKQNPKNREVLTVKANTLVELSFFYNIYRKSPLGLKYAKKSLEIRKKIGEKNDIANSIHNIGNSYYRLGNLDSAIFYMEKHWQYTQRDLGVKYGNLTHLAEMYEEKGDYENANAYWRNTVLFFNENRAEC